MESGWFATSKIKKSKQRVDRLNFFEEVNLDTSPVPGTSDQMDVNMSVKEKSTGSIQAGMGYGSYEGLTLSGGVSQANLFGTGNSLSTQVNTSRINTVYSVSYTNPYYTDDGISRGFDIFKRKTNAGTQTYTSQFTSETYGGGVRFGVPISDDESFQYGLSTEVTTLHLTSGSAQRYLNYVNTYGETTRNLIGGIGWTRDSRDSAILTTDGKVQRAYLEFGLPVSTQQYYRLTYKHQWYYPLSRNLTWMMNGDVGVAGGYGGQELPVFKNFNAGGTGSVRGYDSYSLGPRDLNNLSLGGSKSLVGNAELLFPIPGMEKEKSVRLSAFVDAGRIYGDGAQVPSSMGMRYSAGMAVSWFSPAGPLKLSWAKALNAQPQDKIQQIQFTLGTMF
jgi:outer membrane protein insertion porin family